jgi:hypothetical protein
MASTRRMFTVDLTGLEGLRKNVAMLRREFPVWVYRANEETAVEIFGAARANIVANDSYASGELYESMIIEVKDQGLRIFVGSTSHYAPYVEYGTRPHFPPVSAIREWCRLKGIPESAAYPIARKIAERGTPEQPFFAPAVQIARGRHLKRLRDLVTAAINGRLKTA